MNVLKWVGIGGTVWFAVSVIVAIGWCRSKRQQPNPVGPVSFRLVDADELRGA